MKIQSILISIILISMGTSCSDSRKSTLPKIDNSPQPKFTNAPVLSEFPKQLYKELPGWFAIASPEERKHNPSFLATIYFSPWSMGSHPPLKPLVSEWEKVPIETPFTALSSKGKYQAIFLGIIHTDSGNRSSGTLFARFGLSKAEHSPENNELIWLLPTGVADDVVKLELKERPFENESTRDWDVESFSIGYRKTGEFKADLNIYSNKQSPVYIESYEINPVELDDFGSEEGETTLDLKKDHLGFLLPKATFKFNKNGSVVVIFSSHGEECGNYTPMIVNEKGVVKLEEVFSCGS